MMKLFQMIVFTAVLFGNIYWKWTPNGYLASLIGMGAAFCATVILLWTVDGLRRLKRAEIWSSIRLTGKGRSHQSARQRIPSSRQYGLISKISLSRPRHENSTSHGRSSDTGRRPWEASSDPTSRAAK
jgi:hypothetical protein